MRRRTGPGDPTSAILVRMPQSMIDELDREAEKERDQPSRPEMIRRILEAYLAGAF